MANNRIVHGLARKCVKGERFDLPVKKTDRTVSNMHKRLNSMIGEDRSYIRVQAPLSFLNKLQVQNAKLEAEGNYLRDS